MKVIHTVDSLHARKGGPSRTVTYLCKYLSLSGVDISLMTLLDGNRNELIIPDETNVKISLISRGSTLTQTWAFRHELESEIGNSRSVCLHDHGLWRPSNFVCSRVVKSRRIPFVISARGMLEPWALSKKGSKKQLAWMLYQRSVLKAASVLHATSESEADQFRRLGADHPIAVIPNGIEWSDFLHGVSTENMNRERRTRRILFLSRIHPKKGLVNLIKAWSQCQIEGWELLIAGPDEDGHRMEIERLVQELSLENSVCFLGPVNESEKWKVYHEADIFVLPTYSENFGVVVGEALFSGIPAIVTKGAPWAILEEHKCGWWIDIGIQPLILALREAMSLSDNERVAMGERGRTFASTALSWERIAKDMASVYVWMLDAGPRPGVIRTSNRRSKLSHFLTSK